MHKKAMVAGSLGICLLLVISFSGCVNQEEKTDPAIQKIKDAGKLVVGTNTPYPPMEYIDENGDIVGFDIDVAREIATALGVELEIKDMAFDDLITFNALETGEVDVIIAAITITLERSKRVLFSNAYLNAGQVIIVNETNKDINSEEDLENKIVGVQNGTTSEKEALKYTNSSLVMSYDNYTGALEAILAGEINAIVIDYPAGVGLIKDTPGLEIVGDPFTNELYGIAIKKGNSALKTEIDKVIASISIEELGNKWF